MRRQLVFGAALAIIAAAAAIYFANSNATSARTAAESHAVPTPTRPAGEPIAAPPATSPSPEARSSSAEPFDQVRGLAKRAYDGDRKAQYTIAHLLERCHDTLSLVPEGEDPQIAIWGLSATWSQPLKEWALAEYRRCIRLREEDPFADLPKRADGYGGYDYWLYRSVDAGYAVALADLALKYLEYLPANATTIRIAPSDPMRAVKPIERDSELATLTTAVLSGEPDVLLMAGLELWKWDDVQHTSRGAAFMLAACRAGADCSSDSDIMPFEMCYGAGFIECGPGADVNAMLGRALPPAELAKVYAESVQVEEAVRNRDSATIRSWLDLL